jgi:hypothetical protein
MFTTFRELPIDSYMGGWKMNKGETHDKFLASSQKPIKVCSTPDRGRAQRVSTYYFYISSACAKENEKRARLQSWNTFVPVMQFPSLFFNEI